MRTSLPIRVRVCMRRSNRVWSAVIDTTAPLVWIAGALNNAVEMITYHAGEPQPDDEWWAEADHG